ncbi:AT-hook-containing transcription factor [Camelus ferus]|nr:AT-hook-containing transcription factor [Camelus ferus]
MASSRMEVCWAEPGPGKGPLQRRRWAWAEEGKDADGSTRSLGEKGPFPKASSPELLEDFRRAQQCLQPLEWGPDSQPGGCRDPESGGSAEEGPRVKFPKDESYRPPKARSHSRLPESPARPLIFKSPAEIVREVLLSSGEVCPGKDPPPTHPITRVPQEFQTPEQATKLVHQLQEDYHKLLTKYAEAENTIDQLRLGAKVNLYSDLPQPSHSIHMGTVPQGTKVLSFSIPQPHSVERWPGPAEGPQASEASGWLPENPGIIQNQPAAEPAQELASQASRFLAKGFQQLKAAHTALEEEYLKACREQHLAQQLAGSKGAPGKFDPGRELEAEIFQLGIRLEELKDHVDQNQQKPERAGSDLALDSPPAGPSPEQPAGLPSPLEQAPTPAIQTLCPKPDATSIGPHPLHVNLDLSATSNEAEDRPLGLPGPLRHKELQMEQDLHGLLERYLSVKSPAEAMRMEEEEAGGQGRTLEVDGPAPAPGKAAATRLPTRQLPAQAERSHRGSLEETVEQMAPVKPADFHASMARDSHLQGLDKAGAAPPGPSRHPHPRGTKSSVASHQGSLTSLEGSGISERLPQKSLCQAGGPHQEEPWMASPETDSGFVGSETSRVSPLTQTPEHRLSHIRRAAEPSTPRSRAQRPPSGQDSPLRQRASSFCLERALTAEMAVPGSEFKGRRQMSEQLPHSMTISPSPTPAPVEAVPPRGPTETTSTFLLTRTGRDQAIRELQQEVSRLRLRLEDSLHQPPQGSPTRPASSFDCPARARARDRLVGSSATWGSHYGSKSTERLSGSESEPTSPRLFSEKGRTTEDSPQAAWDGTRRVGGTGRPDRVTFRGQYTGGTVTKGPPGPSPTETLRCPLCGQVGSPSEGDGPDSATSGPEKAATRRNAPSTPSPKQRSKRAESPPRPPPGLWYLAAAPSAPTPPAFAYVSSVPVMPYPSATVFYVPPGPTSAPSARPAAEWPPAASSRPAGGPQRSIQLDLEDLEELNKALSRAVQAAESVRSTTKHMSRSLSAELRQARGLRGSCLF